MFQEYTRTAAVTPPSGATGNPAERRAHPRIPSAHLRVTRVRVANRTARSLVDLSSGGALLELPFQVRPRARFSLQFDTPLERVEVPFQLLRCYVADLKDGITYHAAGAFDGLLNIEELAQPAASGADRLIGALERLRRGLDKSPMRSRADATFDEILSETIIGLRHGESLDLVSLKVRARLTQTYPSLLIMSSSSVANHAATSVSCFGLTFVSRRPLSAHDRRFLKANAQLISMLEDTRDALGEDDASPLPSPFTYSAADWMERRFFAPQHPIAS